MESRKLNEKEEKLTKQLLNKLFNEGNEVSIKEQSVSMYSTGNKSIDLELEMAKLTENNAYMVHTGVFPSSISDIKIKNVQLIGGSLFLDVKFEGISFEIKLDQKESGD